ncbi:MAG: ATPase [Gammaproteobacteria bacterium]|nr:ATPase [Gammaproteobacteria bacterium]
MKLTASEFRAWDRKAITLLGMSGVGKTRLARILRRRHWFHYSGDYRIGTRYLDEPILDAIKRQAMQNPLLRDLLRSDGLHLANNITFENLRPLSAFLGKVGNPERGGIGLREFKRRQSLYREAEISAMRDVPDFIHRAYDIYGYDHFVNDAGGSLCELDGSDAVAVLARCTLIVYIRTSRTDETELIRRADEDPKPLYYREVFLDEQLRMYMRERGVDYVALIEPDDFVRWVFPRLIAARIPRYEDIAAREGYTVTTDQIAGLRDERDFLALIEHVLDAAARLPAAAKHG